MSEFIGVDLARPGSDETVLLFMDEMRRQILGAMLCPREMIGEKGLSSALYEMERQRRNLEILRRRFHPEIDA